MLHSFGHFPARKTQSQCLVTKYGAGRSARKIVCACSPNVLFLGFPLEPLSNWSPSCPIGEAILDIDFIGGL